jgi:predicted  nucleic acid-binding Zn-ribbon protein
MSDLIATHIGRVDADGVTHVGDPLAGCWNCGAGELKYSDNGRVALHHPGSECCESAIDRLINLHTLELARHRTDATNMRNAITEQHQRAEQSFGNASAEARMRAERMQKGYDRRTRDHWQPLADDLKAEIARLEAKRLMLRRAA